MVEHQVDLLRSREHCLPLCRQRMVQALSVLLSKDCLLAFEETAILG